MFEVATVDSNSIISTRCYDGRTVLIKGYSVNSDPI